MSSYFDDASLVMIPSGYKTSKVYSVKPTDGSGDLTFSRSNDTATRVNSAGLIEKVRTNICLQSQTIDNATSWSNTLDAGATINVTANYAAAPDGTTTADRIQMALNGSSYAQRNQSITLSAGGEYTYSVYLKSLSGTPTIIFFYDNVNNKTATLTNDWVRYTWTFTSTGNVLPRFVLEAGTSTSADFLAWGCQLEAGVATDYIATTSAAVSVGPVANVPRLDYLNSSCPRLLLEPQRTNKITYSENQGPTGTNWYPSTTWTVTNNTVVSPSGYQDADTLTETTSTGFHSSYFGGTIDSSYTGTYTISAFAKYNGRFFVLSPKGATERTYFNLQTGVVAQLGGGGVTAKIENYGNGWYRCSVTCSFNNENVNFEHMLASAVGTLQYTGNGTSGVHIWGCMAEAGSYATSYIPTLGAAVTRGADAASKSSINALIGGTSGTIFFEIKTNKTLTSTNFKQFFYYTDASAAQAYMYLNGSNYLVANPSLGNFTSSLQFQADTTYKVAIAYASNDFKLYVNGVERGSSTSGTPINAVNLLSLGSYAGSIEFNEFVFSQYIHFPTRLSNSDLAALTA